ncbi:MAG TPA: acyl-CoA synthetase [Polyangiales bacterium]|nr:acyl-CoA synthetase [Polyangiales bacterium]
MTSDTIPLIARARAHAQEGRVALIDDEWSMSYEQLLAASERAARALLAAAAVADLDGARVAFLVPPGCAYVIAQWGIWRAGGIAVPLCVAHPAPELAYTIDDSGASLLIAHASLRALLEPIARERSVPLIASEDLERHADVDHGADGVEHRARAALPAVAPERGALLLYTSGTTGKPKGVLSSHAILAAQIESVVQAWEWSERDHILHVLPLHHLHGVLNALSAALWSGACCELFPRFDAERVFARIAAARGLTLFMAVPTIYARLLALWEQASEEQRAAFGAGCRQLRLMVSGSAALPVALFERWRELSGHSLLERYGMTEFGMGLGNPLHGERLPGHVGVPFPGVEVRLCDDGGDAVPDGSPGKIQVRGPGVFARYWQKPEATAAAFTADGWFETGDVAQRERGVYRILGRESVDILKTGGYKVSALEIEEALREHPAIRECAVVGVPDPEWGQRVAAAVLLHAGQTLTLEQLRAFGKERLAPYKVPSLLRVVADLPRNAMGKVQKPDVTRWFTTSDLAR